MCWWWWRRGYMGSHWTGLCGSNLKHHLTFRKIQTANMNPYFGK